MRRLSDVFIDDLDAGDLFEELPEPYGQLSTYQRIQITSIPEKVDSETKEVCQLIRKCVTLRNKWIEAKTPLFSTEKVQNSAQAVHPAARLRHRDEISYEPFEKST